MNSVIILPLAKNDIKEAAIWYESKQKNLGKRFVKDVKNTVSKIKLNPNSFSVSYQNIHTAVLSRFPFMVHYTFNSDLKTILITTVLHTSRNPEIWFERNQ